MKRASAVDRRLGRGGIRAVFFLPGVFAILFGAVVAVLVIFEEILPNLNEISSIFLLGIFGFCLIFCIYILLGVGWVIYESRHVVQRAFLADSRLVIKTFWWQRVELMVSEVKSLEIVKGPPLSISISLLERDRNNIAIQSASDKTYFINGQAEGADQFVEELRSNLL